MSASPKRYSAVAVLLHWSIAALLLYNLYIGLYYEQAHGMVRFTILQLHKSIGFTVLFLSLLRLFWRLWRRPPAPPVNLAPWERLAAHITHVAFYFLIIVMPLTGWIIVSASPTNLPTLLYKTLRFPHLGFIHDLPMPTRLTVAKDVTDIHMYLAFFTMGLIALHVAAALKHQFWDRDGVLYRMVPFMHSPKNA